MPRTSSISRGRPNASTFKLGFSTRLLVMEDHTGTHVDASLHFYEKQHLEIKRDDIGSSVSGQVRAATRTLGHAD